MIILLILLARATNLQAQESVVSTTEEQAVTLHEQIVQRGAAEWLKGKKIGKNYEKRAEWYYFQRRFPYDEIPAGARQEAVEKIESMQMRVARARGLRKGATAESGAVWESIGPHNVGGRVRALAVHPTDGATLYVGAAAGGVWKTTNSGVSWTSGFEKMSALTIGALAIDPVNPEVVYAGTGEVRPASDVTYLSDGIFKTTDGGATWKNSGLRGVGAISKIWVSSANPRVIYAATGRSDRNGSVTGNASGRNIASGFYRSSDGGETWTKTRDGVFYDMAVNPLNNDEIYLATSNAVARSTDGGLTFTFSSAASGMSIAGGVRMSIAIAPSSPNVIYALSARTGSGGRKHIADFHVSTNRGVTWQRRGELEDSIFNIQESGGGDYFNCIAVSPVDPNLVLIGALDVHRTTNGGASWTNITNVYTMGWEVTTAHPDQHTLLFDKVDPRRVYLGNDGGTYVSQDAGAGWNRFTTSLAISQFYTVAVDQTREFRVYGGTQDNHTQGMFGSSAVTTSWNELLGGDGFHVVVDKTDPNVIYAESQYGFMARIDVSTGPGEGDYFFGWEISEPGYWSTPMAQSPVDGKFYSGRTSLWYTSNPRAESPTWQTQRPGNGNLMSAIGASPFAAGKLIIGSISGEMFFTTNGGTSWSRSAGIPLRFITDLVYDPVDPNRIYATFSGFSTGHVYRSDDNGATFVDISSNLPDIPVNAIEIDPANPSHLFIGSDVGMFVSLDGGETWVPFNEGLPLATVTDLKIHKASRKLVAATHGRSMFRIGIDNPQPQPALVTPVMGSTIFTPGTLEIRWAGFDGPVRVLISYDGGNTWTEVDAAAAGTSLELQLGIVRSDQVIVKVIEIATGREATSGLFSLRPEVNGLVQGSRGFHAEAIEVRKDHLWATSRTSDSIYRMRNTPTLLSRTGMPMKGLPGKVSDLAYDAAADHFYVLIAPPGGANPRLFTMDTTGTATGEISLAALSGAPIIGVAMGPTGLALVEPGAQARIFVIDPTTGALVSTSQGLLGTTDPDRAGLVWDGQSFVQGVNTARDSSRFPSELQRIRFVDPPVLAERSIVVLPTFQPLHFRSLAFDASSPDPADRVYLATDTAGNFYRFTYRDLFSDPISSAPVLASAPTGLMISAVRPNPARTTSTLDFVLKRGGDLSIGLYNATGEQIRSIAAGRFEQGASRVTVDVAGLPSGVYSVVIMTADGERAVRSLVVVR